MWRNTLGEEQAEGTRNSRGSGCGLLLWDLEGPHASNPGSPRINHALSLAASCAWLLNTGMLTCSCTGLQHLKGSWCSPTPRQREISVPGKPDSGARSGSYFSQLQPMLLCPSELLLSQRFGIVVLSWAEFVPKWFLVLVTLWVNLYKQGFRGVKGEKGEPGQPGLDGLDAPCQLVQYFSFLPPCMHFLCLLRVHLYQCKVVLAEQALHDKHATCMCMSRSLGISAEWGEQARLSVQDCPLTSWRCPYSSPGCHVCVLGNINLLDKYWQRTFKWHKNPPWRGTARP